MTKSFLVDVDLEFEAASIKEAYEQVAGVYIDHVVVDWDDQGDWKPKVYVDKDLHSISIFQEGVEEPVFEKVF